MKVEIESIVTFQEIEDFEENTGLNYESLTDKELFEVLESWWHPGEHDSNYYDSEGINTNFLGYEFKAHGEIFLISRYENGLTIGLSRILK